MQSLLILVMLALTMGGCAHSATAPAPPRASEHRNAAAVRVFVETMLIEIPSSRLTTLGARSFAQVATDSTVRVLTSPHVLIEDHKQIRLELDDSADAWHWQLSADVMADPSVRIGIELMRTTSGQKVHTTMVVAAGQTVVAPTTLAAGEGMTMVLLMRAEVVRSNEDLKRIFERKMRERRAALG